MGIGDQCRSRSHARVRACDLALQWSHALFIEIDIIWHGCAGRHSSIHKKNTPNWLEITQTITLPYLNNIMQCIMALEKTFVYKMIQMILPLLL